MRAYIDAGELRIVAGNQTYRTLIPRSYARTLAAGIRRARRHPGERRWSWAGGGSLTTWSTKNDPWPMLVLHDRHELEPTVTELDQFISALDQYGRNR